MTKFVLSSGNDSTPLKSLIEQVGTGGIEVCDDSGTVLAYVLPPADREELLYRAADEWAEANRDVLLRRVQTKGGITTEELCRKVGMPYHGVVLERK